MRSIGSLLFVVVLLVGTADSQAEVRATIDRQNVSLGDTLRLTITATENEEIADTDLRPLLVDFEILQRSTSTSTSIVNGQRTHSRQISLDITPRRQGALEIPPVRVGRGRSNSLSVNVGPPADSIATEETVLFEAELDRDSVYVQGQVILTLRIHQAINLDNRGVSELKLEDAFVKQLEQKSFQRNIDGRPWLVHEIRYAIFPAYSGTLEIPPQTFSGRESRPRRSFFDLNSGGRLLQRKSEPLTIEVLPRPSSFTGDTWLPASLVSIEENWSTPPGQLRAGESTTRTITLRGEGLQGAQLPPILFEPVEGLKYYPDQPVIADTEIDSGLLGSRQDSAALVPTRAGTWEIPEIRVPWWDTASQRVRYAELPARTIEVRAADPASTSAPAPAGVPTQVGQTIAIEAARNDAGSGVLVWQLIAAFSCAGWMLSVWLLWRKPRRQVLDETSATANGNEPRAFKQLSAACAANSAEHARSAVITWTSALFPDDVILSLDHVVDRFQDQRLSEELGKLNRCLFSTPAGNWEGRTLAEIVRGLRSEHRRSKPEGNSRLELYPT